MQDVVIYDILSFASEAVSTTWTQILATPKTRGGVAFFNAGATDIYIRLGGSSGVPSGTCTAATATFVLAPGETATWTIRSSVSVWHGTLAGASTLNVHEVSV